jgi:hypothetical protein
LPASRRNPSITACITGYRAIVAGADSVQLHEYRRVFLVAEADCPVADRQPGVFRLPVPGFTRAMAPVHLP